METDKGNLYDWLIKILIVGDSGVGKTNILLQACEKRFVATHLATIGIDFKIKTIEVDNKKIKMQIWDTAGQERFKTITQTYFKGAMGIIMTYAVNDRQSFNNIENWMNEVRKHSSDSISLILVGNKCDLNQVVDSSEGQSLAKQYKIPFLETSAKEDVNIEEIFTLLGKDIKEKILQNDNLLDGIERVKIEKQNNITKDDQEAGCKC